jgi:hypothetical protein
MLPRAVELMAPGLQRSQNSQAFEKIPLGNSKPGGQPMNFTGLEPIQVQVVYISPAEIRRNQAAKPWETSVSWNAQENPSQHTG